MSRSGKYEIKAKIDAVSIIKYCILDNNWFINDLLCNLPIFSKGINFAPQILANPNESDRKQVLEGLDFVIYGSRYMNGTNYVPNEKELLQQSNPSNEIHNGLVLAYCKGKIVTYPLNYRLSKEGIKSVLGHIDRAGSREHIHLMAINTKTNKVSDNIIGDISLSKWFINEVVEQFLFCAKLNKSVPDSRRCKTYFDLNYLYGSEHTKTAFDSFKCLVNKSHLIKLVHDYRQYINQYRGPNKFYNERAGHIPAIIQADIITFMFAYRFINLRAFKCIVCDCFVEQSLDSIADKTNLHILVQRLANKQKRKSYLASTQYLRDVDTLPSSDVNNIYVIRGNGITAKGRDVYFVNTDTFADTRKMLLAQKPNSIISEYIHDHALFKGYKFHLRMYWAVTRSYGGTFTCSLFDRAMLYLAKLPMSESQNNMARPINRNYHDTHGDHKPFGKVLLFPKDYDAEFGQGKASKVLECVNEALVLPFELAKSNFKVPPCAQSSYMIFGLDILPRKDGSIILIEINYSSPLYPSHIFDLTKEECNNYTNDINSWLHNIVIRPFLV